MGDEVGASAIKTRPECWATYQRDSRAGKTDGADTQDPRRTLAGRYNTRKSIDHGRSAPRWISVLETAACTWRSTAAPAK